MIRTLYPVTATAICVVAASGFAQAQTTPAPYIAQAKKLLPTIGMEIEPGDGGEAASDGKLLYENLLPLYVRLAFAQKQTGDTTGARATYARACALCTQKKSVYQPLVEIVVIEGLRAGFYDEALAFSKKNDTDGFRASVIAEYQARVRKDLKAADATLVAGVTKGTVLDKAGQGKETRVMQLFRILDTAVRYKLPGATASARAAFAPYVAVLDSSDLCRAVSLGVPGISADDAEARLRTEMKGNPGYLGMGLLDLGKTGDAQQALVQINRDNKVPATLILRMTPAAFVAIARRAKIADPFIAAMQQLKYEGRDTPAAVLALNEAVGPEVYDESASQTGDTLLLLPRAALTPLLRKQATSLRTDFAKSVASARKRAARKGEYEYSAQQGSGAYRLAQIAPLDPDFTRKHLSKIVEPRYRALVVVALAAQYARK